jgi:hypothetical protein
MLTNEFVASELTPWEEDSPVINMWLEHEKENLSSAGKNHGVMLGTWFAEKYYKSGLTQGGTGKVSWRCSKSDRGKESGYDFVSGFNKAIEREVMGPHPDHYPVDADNYFRPWKVHKDKADAIKDKMTTPEWIQKAEENKDFLVNTLRTVGAKESLIAKLPKALWACTYLYALQEVEEYWPQNEGERHALGDLINPETNAKIVELALWVWEQRFLHSGVQTVMGGRICAEMFEV